MPILDGLNEIAEEDTRPGNQPDQRRAAAGMGAGGDLPHPAVQGRTQNSLERDEVTLQSAAAIQLCTLNADEVRAYLDADAAGQAAKARWKFCTRCAQVLRLRLGETLRTPLMVSLARAIYNPRPDEVVGALA